MSEKNKKNDLDFRKTVITYENKEYLWHRRRWSCDSIIINTALAQKITVYALKNGLLTREDFCDPEYDNPKTLQKIPVTKIDKE